MGIMVRPETRVAAAISIAVSAVVVLCFLWWADHERLNLENQTLQRQLQSVEGRLQELVRNRGQDANR